MLKVPEVRFPLDVNVKNIMIIYESLPIVIGDTVGQEGIAEKLKNSKIVK